MQILTCCGIDKDYYLYDLDTFNIKKEIVFANTKYIYKTNEKDWHDGKPSKLESIELIEIVSRSGCKGYGGLLVETIKNHAKLLKADIIFGSFRPNQGQKENLKRFYEKHDFEVNEDKIIWRNNK